MGQNQTSEYQLLGWFGITEKLRSLVKTRLRSLSIFGRMRLFYSIGQSQSMICLVLFLLAVLHYGKGDVYDDR